MVSIGRDMIVIEGVLGWWLSQNKLWTRY